MQLTKNRISLNIPYNKHIYSFVRKLTIIYHLIIFIIETIEEYKKKHICVLGQGQWAYVMMNTFHAPIIHPAGYWCPLLQVEQQNWTDFAVFPAERSQQSPPDGCRKYILTHFITSLHHFHPPPPHASVWSVFINDLAQQLQCWGCINHTASSNFSWIIYKVRREK